MSQNCKNLKSFAIAAAVNAVFNAATPQLAEATAPLDTDVVETKIIRSAPQIVPILPATPVDQSSASEMTEEPNTLSLPSLPTASGATAPAAGQPTYSIRVPLGVAGSVLPRLESSKPTSPLPGAFMPKQRVENRAGGADGQDFSRPVAWRATAEAIRNQAPSSSLQTATLAADFKTSYTTLFREAPIAGWGLTSLSLPAGHFLVKIPKSGESDSSDDGAAWLIIVLSPIDSTSTEMRVKIQSRRPSTYAPAVSNFIKQCQMKATGNELL
ncbi:MAG: hypothetical protein SGJ27_05815 [Candidatus Melainabacteria bacterium]|nr:hypothetical protein [Candidatus Melainabacteria bacterium]